MMKNGMKLGLTMLLVTLMILMAACGNTAGSAAPISSSSGSAEPAAEETKEPAKTQFISIATASMGGSYYPIGVGMADVFQKSIPNIEPKVEVTGGATENPKLVGSGDSDIGITNANLAYAAYEGSGIFAGNQYADLRMMFGGVAPGTIHMVVKGDSAIRTYADLKGKKVAVGPQGGGGLSLLPDLFAVYEFGMEDIKANYMSYDEGVQALIDGHVDAAFIQAPHPAPAIKNIQGSNIAFRLLELTEEEREPFLKQYPYYNAVDIPKDVYGTDHDVKTIGSSNVVVINANIDETMVYQMTKAVFENLEDIYVVHPSAASIKLDTAVDEMIPMHPGAMRYFKEAGAKGTK